MELLHNIILVAQSISISLGVGASTLAILNFLSAIKDGEIDETERRMMGIVYRVLRLVMYAVLVLAIAQGVVLYAANANPFVAINLISWIAVFVLYVNSYLMTLHLMPSTFGPALQAGSWYMLGLVSALRAIQAVDMPLLGFIFIYIAVLLGAIVVVNTAMSHVKHA